MTKENQDSVALLRKLEDLSNQLDCDIKQYYDIQPTSFYERKLHLESQIEAAKEEDKLTHEHYTDVLDKTIELRKKYAELQDENQAVVDAELDRLKEVANEMMNEMKTLSENSTNERSRQEDFQRQLHELESDIVNGHQNIDDCNNLMKKATIEFERESSICLNISKAIESKRKELNDVKVAYDAMEVTIEDTKATNAELQTILNELQQKQNIHDETMDQRQQEMNQMKRLLDIEKARNHSLNTNRLESALLDKKLLGKLRQANRDLTLGKKKVEIARRDYQKRILIKDGISVLLVKGKNQLQDNMLMIKKLQKEVESQATEIDFLRKTVQENALELLSQKKITQEKGDKLFKLLHDVEQSEARLLYLRGEERKKEKVLILHKSKKDSIASQIIKLRENEKSLHVQCKMEQIVINEHEKRITFFQGRIREFVALEATMNLEKNNFKASMKKTKKSLERAKETVHNADGQLKALSLEKSERDCILKSEEIENQSKRIRKDTLKIDLLKLQTSFTSIRENVNKKVREISTIKSLLREKQKQLNKNLRECKVHSEIKDRKVIVLQEQNEEIEKIRGHVRVYEEILDRGKLSLKRKEDDKRIIELKVHHMQNKFNFTRAALQRAFDYDKEINQVKEMIQNEHERFKILSMSWENPNENPSRFREVGNSMLETSKLKEKLEALRDKTLMIENRMLENEAAIEVLDERTNQMKILGKKIRELINPILFKINDYKWKFKNINKKIMAYVSELSMLQVTALRLKQEHELLQKVSNMIKVDNQCLEHFSEKKENNRTGMMNIRSDNNVGSVTWRYMGPNGCYDVSKTEADRNVYLHRTAAEARPVAYIPDKSIDIPKPYGKFAPFKPTHIPITVNADSHNDEKYMHEIQI